jgi:murein DD-endopeptidase MepM/ murein hydrolase activator NlpD
MVHPDGVARLRRLVLLGLALCAAVGWAALPAQAAPTTARWGWPLAGSTSVARGFAPPAEPWLPGHRGVDLRGRAGELVRAAGAGVVHFAGRIAGVGVVSVLHPDGLLTTYEPVRPLVHPGQRVRLGQPLGRLTAVGSHCAPAACLHWGLRRGTAYLDPLSLVGAGRVRLLPLHPTDRLPSLPATLSAAGGVTVGAASLRRRRRRNSQPDATA